MQKMLVVLKLALFILKLVVFPFLVVVSVSYCIYCSWYMVSRAWLNFTVPHLEVLEGRDLSFSKIVANLYQGLATNTVKHHKKFE